MPSTSNENQHEGNSLRNLNPILEIDFNKFITEERARETVSEICQLKLLHQIAAAAVL